MGDGFITRRGLGSGSSGDLSNYYTKTEINSLLANKVSNATLDDYYNKSGINSLLANKVSSSTLDNYYNKSGIDSLLANKVSSSSLDNYYTKSTVDSKLSGKMNTIDYRIGSWTPQFYWWHTDNEAGHRNGNPYYYQDGDYVRIGRLCYINFTIQGYLGPLGGDYIGIGNLPFNSYGSSSITFRAFARLDGRDGHVNWSPPSSRPVGLTIHNRNYMRVLFESTGYIRYTWPASGSFYVQGSGVYIANGNLSSANNGEDPVEGEFNNIIHEPLFGDPEAGDPEAEDPGAEDPGAGE